MDPKAGSLLALVIGSAKVASLIFREEWSHGRCNQPDYHIMKGVRGGRLRLKGDRPK